MEAFFVVVLIETLPSTKKQTPIQLKILKFDLRKIA